MGPTPPGERRSFVRSLKVAFVGLVAISAGLMTIQADVGPVWILAAMAFGGAIGIVLVWIAFPRVSTGTDREDPFDGF